MVLYVIRSNFKTKSNYFYSYYDIVAKSYNLKSNLKISTIFEIELLLRIQK